VRRIIRQGASVAEDLQEVEDARCRTWKKPRFSGVLEGKREDGEGAGRKNLFLYLCQKRMGGANLFAL